MAQNLVLIVEHDAWLRTSLRALFEQAGAHVVCASNGPAGLRRAQQLRPYVIVLSAALPELRTDELVRELRQLGGMPILLAHEVLAGRLRSVGNDPPLARPLPATAGRRSSVARWVAPCASARRRSDEPAYGLPVSVS